MEHSDFRIGTLFRTGSGLWQCTDIGTRTIAAIHLEAVDIDGSEGERTLNKLEAETAGLFHGPPYIVGEFSFDEYDIEGCWPDNLSDDPGYDERSPKQDWSQAVRGPWWQAFATLQEQYLKRFPAPNITDGRIQNSEAKKHLGEDPKAE
jgi:hypothetical protein